MRFLKGMEYWYCDYGERRKVGEMKMSETEKAIENLNTAKLILCNQQMLTSEMCIRIGQAITDAIALLKEQEEIRHGEWKWSHDGECSECGYHNSNFNYKYCPMCGAMMDA